MIGYRKILEFFFQIHDPTTENRQGNDQGREYRSAIYYTSAEQKAMAEKTIADVNASGLWPNAVVTEVEPCQVETKVFDELRMHAAGKGDTLSSLLVIFGKPK